MFFYLQINVFNIYGPRQVVFCRMSIVSLTGQNKAVAPWRTLARPEIVGRLLCL